MFNLIQNPWIRVTRKSGASGSFIAPWEITDAFDSDPIVSLDAVRPDFNGGLIQFLIGLVQTTMPPADEEEWIDLLEEPPPPEDLKSAFETVAEAFVLDGDGSRFMQEHNLQHQKNLKPDNYWDIYKLFIDGASEGRDLFLKFGKIKKICPICSAQALHTLQISTSGFGRGHVSTLRHGGPITSIVTGNTLWETVWFNIMTKSSFRGNQHSDRTDLVGIFPWLTDPQISDEDGGKKKILITNPGDVDLLQMYWPMPLRIHLIIDREQSGECDLCGTKCSSLISKFLTLPYGIGYSGVWHHPLSPHAYEKKKDMPEPVPDPIPMAPSWIAYRRWLGLVQNDRSYDKRLIEPARVVSQIRNLQREDKKLFLQHPTRLKVFGYQLENAKARCYYEGEMPLIPVDSSVNKEFEITVEGMIQVASLSLTSLKKCIIRAWYDADLNEALNKAKEHFPRKKGSKGKGKVKKFLNPDQIQSLLQDALPAIDNEFWQVSEHDFYSILGSLPDTLASTPETPEIIKRRWVQTLFKSAEFLFDRYAQTNMIGITDPQRIALARHALRKEISIYNPSIQTHLSLNVQEKEPDKGTKGEHDT
ncbi:type I-E CRISPR-associated protein Cse1/CasA [Methanosphaerula subterraneus]|uniref:type I-E CRISPR-associated protein Cse1/CasA n=1 Tax=Methanosphaerula subterraneus TaxID=3350244 RepID=UPI003F8358A2